MFAQMVYLLKKIIIKNIVLYSNTNNHNYNNLLLFVLVYFFFQKRSTDFGKIVEFTVFVLENTILVNIYFEKMYLMRKKK